MTCQCRHREKAVVQLQDISNPALELGGQHLLTLGKILDPFSRWGSPMAQNLSPPPVLNPKIGQPVTSHYTDHTILAASCFC